MPCRHEGGVYFLFFLIMVCSEWTKSEFNGKSVWKKCKWPHEDRELRVLKWTNPRCRLTSSVHRDEEIEEVWRGGSEGSEVPGESRARSESELLSCSKSPSSFGLIVVLLANREPNISSRTQMFSWTSDAKKKKKGSALRTICTLFQPTLKHTTLNSLSDTCALCGFFLGVGG